MRPLVSVICISYNHEPYIREALGSVFAQTYEALEIIIVDDASTDHSQALIRELITAKQNIRFIGHDQNRGYTKTFNEALSLAKGEFVIDFSLDDVMLPEFVSRSVEKLEALGENFGVSFSNADYIDSDSKLIGNHNEILRKKGLIDSIPSGDVFGMILKRYFICTPSMVMRKSILDRLGGYDETLAYEDFDFWVRSSRITGYAFIDQVLIKKRKLINSLSAQQYKHRSNEQLNSTIKVCEKALHLCKTRPEREALMERIEFELGKCLTSGAFDAGEKLYSILKSLKENSLRLLMYKTLLVLKLNYQFLNKKRKKGLV